MKIAGLLRVREGKQKQTNKQTYEWKAIVDKPWTFSHLPLKEYTGFIRKIPVSCSRFTKQSVNCWASLSRSLEYWSILSPQRCARLFCSFSILSKAENTPSSRLPPCFKLCSVLTNNIYMIKTDYQRDGKMWSERSAWKGQQDATKTLLN